MDLVCKRLEYIYQQRIELNQRTFEILKFFTYTFVVICGTSVGAYEALRSVEGSSFDPQALLLIAAFLIAAVSVLSVFLLIANFFVWVANKNEEFNIVPEFSSKVDTAYIFKKFVTWSEFYALIYVIGCFGVGIVILRDLFLPAA